MKIGVFTTSVSATIGGGFVLRDEMARAALKFQGRHHFELVAIPPEDPPPPPLAPPPPPPPKPWLKARWDWLVMTPDPPLPPPPPPPPPGRPPEKRFLDEVKSRRFDLLWFNAFDPIYIDVPFVMNIFDLQHRVKPFFPEVSSNGQWTQREILYADASRRAAFVTVGSEEAKEQVCHFYGVPPDNVRVLPFPTPQRAIDIAAGKLSIAATQDIRSKYDIRGDFLFYPAQFWPHKNHVNLLRALKMLRDQRGRSISVVFTGSDQGNRPHVENVVRELGLEEQVRICGFVPYEDVLAFYREARALSYLSLQGPENLPPLEAMALERPIILSEMPGVRKLYGDGPVLVDPCNPQSIADGIRFVLDNPDEILARAEASKQFAIRNDYEKYLEAFQAILDEFEPYRRCWP